MLDPKPNLVKPKKHRDSRATICGNQRSEGGGEFKKGALTGQTSYISLPLASETKIKRDETMEWHKAGEQVSSLKKTNHVVIGLD